MSPIGLLLGLASSWALLRLWLVPLAKDRWNAIDLKSKMARAGSLVVLEKTRDLAGFGAIAIAATLTFVQFAGWIAGADATWPRVVISATNAIYGALKAISESYGLALTILGLVGAASALWFAARKAKQRVVDVWMKEASATFQSLQADISRIDEARQDPALAPLVARVDTTMEQLIALGEPTAEQAAQFEAKHRQLGEAMTALSIAWAGARIDVPELVGQPDEAPVAGPPWQRILRVLSSRKLSEDLGIVRKPLGRVITGLLFVSLIGWASEPLADSARLNLNNMRISAANDQAQRQLDGMMSRLPPPVPAKAEKDDPPQATSAAVRRASQLVARGVVRQVVRDGLIAAPRPSTGVASGHDQAAVVRAALIDETIDPSGPHAKVRQAAMDAVAAGDPATLSNAEAHIRREIEPVIQRISERDPRRMGALLARLEARYATPMSATDAQGKLTEKLIDEVFNTVDARPADELGKQAQKLSKEFGKKAVQNWVDTQTKAFVTRALSDVALPDVERALFMESRRNTRDMLVSLRAPDVEVWQPSAATSKEVRVASAVSDIMAEADDGPGPRARTPAGYDDLFPRAAAAPPELSGGGGGGGGGGEKFSRTRASSFHLASSSFRARGVVVGRPLAGRALDVTDIRWTISQPARAGQPHRVSVALRVIDGPRSAATWRPVGTFDAAVLNQGLRYAADGRVVATTIIPGDRKLVQRQTSLHPALADTPLGCRVIASDRLVDTFSFSRPGPGIQQLTMDRVGMGMWLTVAKLAEAAARAPVCPIDELREVISENRLRPVSFSPVLRQSVDGLIAGLGRATPGSEALLKFSDRCAAGPAARLATCLCTNTPKLPARYWFPEDHTSQVRERSATLTPDLAWLKPSAQGLETLDFVTHTTFAVHVRETGDPDETTAYTFLFPRGQLTALRQEVVRRTPGFVASELNGPSYGDFVRPLEDFVLVQRLARAALEGQLGRDFPLAKLITLEKATRRYVPSQPTLRWEPADAQTFQDQLEAKDPEAAKMFHAAYVDQMQRVRQGAPTCGPVSK